LALLISEGSSVIEFGAGRLVLPSALPEGCSYTPSDLVDRGPGTIVCDLNGPALPDFGRYSTAVFSGVLEYVNDVPRLLGHLAKSVDAIVCSYAVTDLSPRERLRKGWVNDYSRTQLMAIFASSGFECSHEHTWKSQMLFRFENTALSSG